MDESKLDLDQLIAYRNRPFNRFMRKAQNVVDVVLGPIIVPIASSLPRFHWNDQR